MSLLISEPLRRGSWEGPLNDFLIQVIHVDDRNDDEFNLGFMDMILFLPSLLRHYIIRLSMIMIF